MRTLAPPLLLLGLLTWFVAACAAPDPVAEATATVLVEPWVMVDVFSGRPNPEWTMDSREIDAVRALLTTLPAAESALPAAEGRLGMRGFRLGALWIEDQPVMIEVPVEGDILTVTAPDGTRRYLSDTSGLLYELLVAHASDHLTPALYRLIFDSHLNARSNCCATLPSFDGRFHL